MMDSLVQFREAMQTAGIQPPAEIKTDGHLHRFCNSDKHRDQSAWYVFYTDGIPGGSFGDWRLGVKKDWHTKLSRPLNDIEQMDYQKKIIQMQQVHAAIDRQRAVEASEQAEKIWSQSSLANNDYPYLIKKSIQAYGIRVHKGQLIIPIRQEKTLQSLQFISADGTKRFLKGGRVQGGYFTMGDLSQRAILCLCEGYATGASLFQATGYPVVTAFHAGNLKLVAQSLRQAFPECTLIVCADDDSLTPGNPGLTQAKEATVLVHGFLAIPDFGPEPPPGMSDFNDLHEYLGIEAVRNTIETVIQNTAAIRLNQNSTVKANPFKCLTLADELETKCIDWIWPEWLAAGKLHLLAGAPGTGKTTLALNMAATISRGGEWPDGSVCEPGKVLIWSAEDDPQDTLLPRLLAHGIGTKSIYFVNRLIRDESKDKGPRVFDPARDLPQLCQEALSIGNIRLVIIDPVVNVVACDSHKNAEVRRSLEPLMLLSEQLKAAILGITHFSKGTIGRDPLNWVAGSIAFGGLARFVWLTNKTKHTDGSIQRLLVRAKSNHGCEENGYYYQIEQTAVSQHPDLMASRIIFTEAVQGSAEDLLSGAINQGFSEEPSALEEAIDFLKVLLADGPVTKKWINLKAGELGIKTMTLRRAQTALEIKPSHEGYGKNSVWTWAMPSKMFKTPKDVHPKDGNIFERPHEQLCDLEKYHPSIIEGYKLSDILAHAEPEDYEDLKNPEVLKTFAQALKEAGKIKPCSPHVSEIGTAG